MSLTTSTGTTMPPETHTSTITSYMPFTTPYSFPNSCSTKYRLDGPSLMAFDPAYGIDVETGVDCGPALFTTWWNYGLVAGTGDYSTLRSVGPFSCPIGWTTVASSTKDSTSIATMCCPSDFYLVEGAAGSIGGRCLSDVTSGMVLTYGSTSDDSDDFTMATTTLTASSSVGAIDMWGWNLEYPITVTASATSTSTSTSTSVQSSTSVPSTTKTTSSTSSATSDTSGSSPGGGLTAGAKTGIGVGVGVGAIGVIALLAALWIFRRRGKKQPTADVGSTQQPSAQQQQPMQQQHQYGPSELPNQWVPSELDATRFQRARSPIELGSP